MGDIVIFFTDIAEIICEFQISSLKYVSRTVYEKGKEKHYQPSTDWPLVDVIHKVVLHSLPSLLGVFIVRKNEKDSSYILTILPPSSS